MNRVKQLIVVIGALALALVLVAGPALATEEGGGGGSGEREKIELPSDPHDRVGLILIGAMVVGGALALVNARKQLRGERKQASGEFRWR